jgi:uncharacterized membrane protein YccC
VAERERGPDATLVRITRWVRERDPGLSALRRAGRAAIIAPLVFAFALNVLDNPTVATFAAFGTVSMLLFVDFTGPVAVRLESQAGLVVGGLVLVCIGTLASGSVWTATAAMVVVGFGVLFAGIVSSVLAGASTAVLVGFILAVTLPGSVDTIPERLFGWLLAGAASLIGILVLWPAPTREPLRMSAAQACSLLGQRLRAEVECSRQQYGAGQVARRSAAASAATAAVTALRSSFFSSAHRPGGLSTEARLLVRIVDQIVWLDKVLDRMPMGDIPTPTDTAIGDVNLAAAALMERSGAALSSGTDGDPDELERDLERLRTSRRTMERAVTVMLPGRKHDAGPGFVSSLRPSFRAHEMSFATSAIATNIRLAVAASRRSWVDRLLGRQPTGVPSAGAAARRRLAAHLEPHSVWLHNSVRGAAGLGLAVLVAELAAVGHSFWVVFGTLAVLRSNALSTGQSALRVLLGTAFGIVIGSGVILLVGPHPGVYWALLPFAIAFTGFAPAAFSFAAGQAGFTMTLLILVNIVQPVGWKIGLVRAEDIALGCAVSLVVGALFWPRGAVTALCRELGEAFTAAAQYFGGAIEYGVTRCDHQVPAAPTPETERFDAAAAARRLDDAFRSFLAERGTAEVRVGDANALITTVAVLRLTGDAIVDLWDRDEDPPIGDRARARLGILDSGQHLVGWYERTAQAMTGTGVVPDPLDGDVDADARLLAAIRRDLAGQDGRGTTTAIKMIWTADHIDALRRVQADIVDAARATAMRKASRRSWLTGRRPAR